jgi:hypothetical protein
MSKIISHAQLVALVESLSGRARFAYIFSNTDARPNKKSRTTDESLFDVFGCNGIRKVNERNVIINLDYAKVVNKRRVKEGLPADFKADAAKGGALRHLCLKRMDNGTDQIRTYTVAHKKDKAWYVKEGGADHGATLNEREVARLKAEFLPLGGYASKQGIKAVLQPLDFKLESIKVIHLENEKYILAGI